ncbi:hypothetical protein COBT_001259 [Conglomerata obtusa]
MELCNEEFKKNCKLHVCDSVCENKAKKRKLNLEVGKEVGDKRFFNTKHDMIRLNCGFEYDAKKDISFGVHKNKRKCLRSTLLSRNIISKNFNLHKKETNKMFDIEHKEMQYELMKNKNLNEKEKKKMFGIEHKETHNKVDRIANKKEIIEDDLDLNNDFDHAISSRNTQKDLVKMNVEKREDLSCEPRLKNKIEIKDVSIDESAKKDDLETYILDKNVKIKEVKKEEINKNRSKKSHTNQYMEKEIDKTIEINSIVNQLFNFSTSAQMDIKNCTTESVKTFKGKIKNVEKYTDALTIRRENNGIKILRESKNIYINKERLDINAHSSKYEYNLVTNGQENRKEKKYDKKEIVTGNRSHCNKKIKNKSGNTDKSKFTNENNNVHDNNALLDNSNIPNINKNFIHTYRQLDDGIKILSIKKSNYNEDGKKLVNNNNKSIDDIIKTYYTNTEPLSDLIDYNFPQNENYYKNVEEYDLIYNNLNQSKNRVFYDYKISEEGTSGLDKSHLDGVICNHTGHTNSYMCDLIEDSNTLTNSEDEKDIKLISSTKNKTITNVLYDCRTNKNENVIDVLYNHKNDLTISNDIMENDDNNVNIRNNDMNDSNGIEYGRKNLENMHNNIVINDNNVSSNNDIANITNSVSINRPDLSDNDLIELNDTIDENSSEILSSCEYYTNNNNLDFSIYNGPFSVVHNSNLYLNAAISNANNTLNNNRREENNSNNDQTHGTNSNNSEDDEILTIIRDIFNNEEDPQDDSIMEENLMQIDTSNDVNTNEIVFDNFDYNDTSLNSTEDNNNNSSTENNDTNIQPLSNTQRNNNDLQNFNINSSDFYDTLYSMPHNGTQSNYGYNYYDTINRRIHESDYTITNRFNRYDDFHRYNTFEPTEINTERITYNQVIQRNNNEIHNEIHNENNRIFSRYLGIRKKDYKKLKMYPYKNKVEKHDNDSCVICYQKFLANSIIIEVKCGHYFHIVCVKPWLRLHAICPMCRKAVD